MSQARDFKNKTLTWLRIYFRNFSVPEKYFATGEAVHGELNTLRTLPKELRNLRRIFGGMKMINRWLPTILSFPSVSCLTTYIIYKIGSKVKCVEKLLMLSTRTYCPFLGRFRILGGLSKPWFPRSYPMNSPKIPFILLADNMVSAIAPQFFNPKGHVF